MMTQPNCERFVFRGRGTCDPEDGEDLCAGCVVRAAYIAEQDRQIAADKAADEAAAAAEAAALGPRGMWLRHPRLGRLLGSIMRSGFERTGDEFGHADMRSILAWHGGTTAALAFDLLHVFGSEEAAIAAIRSEDAAQHGLDDDIYQESVFAELRRWVGEP